jgi:hypothetical protein
MPGAGVEAVGLAARVGGGPALGDAESVLAPAVAAFCHARLRRAAPPAPSPPSLPMLDRERRYWFAAAALERGDVTSARDEARQGLALLGTLPNDELRWRLATVAKAAARHAGDKAALAQMAAVAQAAEQRLAGAWPAHYESYARRPDLVNLKARAGDD